MRELIRRVFWHLPALILEALVLFAVVTWALPRRPDALPLFFNPTPTSMRQAVEKALDGLRNADPRAEREIQRLGGSFVVFARADLASLDIATRRKLAGYLRPLRARMDLTYETAWEQAPQGAQDDSAARDRELVFWERFAEDHEFDYRPQVAARLVNRLIGGHGRLHRADLIALDTFALPAYVSHLGTIRTEQDIERARQLVDLIAHVTESSWHIRADASVQEAREVVTQVRRFWDRQGPTFTEFTPFEAVAGRLSQSEISIWMRGAARELRGLDESEALIAIAAGWRKTAPVFIATLLGSVFLGPLAVTLVPIRFHRGRRIRVAVAAAIAAIVGAIFMGPSPTWHPVTGLMLGTLVTALVLFWEVHSRLDYRNIQALGARSHRRNMVALFEWITPSLPTLGPLVVLDAAVLTLCLELTERSGLFGSLIRAIPAGDAPYVLFVALGLGIFTTVAQVLGDSVLDMLQGRMGDL
jgi:hypothetical protein